MAEYISLPVEQDEGEFYDLGVEVFQGHEPEWVPADGNADTWLMEAVAAMAARVAEVATSVATDLYIDSGQRLDGVLFVAAEAATGVTTWTAQDTAGYTIPAGSVVGIDVGGGELVTFQTVDDYAILAGATTVTDVAVTAVTTGVDANGLSGDAVIVDAPGEITDVTFTEPTGGGTDGETTEDYVERLGRFRRLRSAAPIVASDFPDILVEEIPGVARATYLDGYDPSIFATYSPTNMATWLGRAITVTGVDEDGEPLATDAFNAAKALFNGDPATGQKGRREANFLVNVLHPHYSSWDVIATLVAYQGWNPADVDTAATAALQEFLAPSRWGQPISGEEIVWENTTTLRASDIYAILLSVEGVKAVTSLTFAQSSVADEFTTDSITAGDWAFDSGAGTLAVSGGQLVPSSTALKSIYRPTGLFVDPYTRFKFITGASVTGGVWKARVKRLDANNGIRVQATPTALTIRKLDGGVDTQLATTAATIGTSVSRWLVGSQIDNVVSAQLWTTDPDLGGSPSVTLSYTLAGADATKFGTGKSGYPGLEVTPAGTDERYDSFRTGGAAFTSADKSLPTLSTEPIPLTRPGTMAVTVT